MDELVPVLEDLAVEVRFDEPQDVLEQRVERGLVRAHGRDGQGRALQEVVVVDLRRRDFELVAEPGRCRSKTA